MFDTTTLDAIDDAMRGGAPAITKNMTPGETRTGIIADIDRRQTTKFNSTEPDFFPDGSPKMQIVLTLSTDYADDMDDDGGRMLYIKEWGSQRKALLAAIAATGARKFSQAIKPGATVTVTYHGKTRINGKNGQSWEENTYTYEIDSPLDTALAETNNTPTNQSNSTNSDANMGPAASTNTPQDPPTGQIDTARIRSLINAGLGDDIILQNTPGLTPTQLAQIRNN